MRTVDFPVTPGRFEQMALQLPEGVGKVGKGCSVAQGAGLSLDHRKMVPPIIDCPRRQVVGSLDDPGMLAYVLGTKGSMVPSAKQAADLSKHLGYAEKFGKGGVRELENGRVRYYGEVQSAAKPGEMAGRRYVNEYDAVREVARVA